MRIAVFQCHDDSTAVEARLRLLAQQVHRAASQGARLLIAPELYLGGYDIDPAAMHERAQSADGAGAEQIAALARRTGVGIVYGYAERAADGLYNAAQAVLPDGRRCNHRKTHLFGATERQLFAPAHQVCDVFDLEGWQIAILICYEVEFPENARLAALAGADLIVVPTALMRPYHVVSQTLVPARAYENQLFIAYANYVGRSQSLHYVGESCVVAPHGGVLARADGQGHALLAARLDRTLKTRSETLNPYLSDRRAELYSDLWRTHPPGGALHAGSESG